MEPPKGKPPDDWEPRPQTLFRATQFGDDVDRPLKKSDGSWTYFAADIAYHLDKYRRGFANLIDVLGRRPRRLCQAHEGGGHGGDRRQRRRSTSSSASSSTSSTTAQPVRMSKRAGTFVTLREVVDEVGKDVFRFMMLTRRNDQALDFDFAKVTEQSKDNPVFYVQYAHARAASVHAPCQGGSCPATICRTRRWSKRRSTPLIRPGGAALIRLLAGGRASSRAPPKRMSRTVSRFTCTMSRPSSTGCGIKADDATLRFILAEDPALTRPGSRSSRRRICHRVRAAVFGVEPVEEM